MKAKTIDQIVREGFSAKRFEPKARLHDWYGFHSHRFPIKGGISVREVMIRTPNATLAYLKGTANS